MPVQLYPSVAKIKRNGVYQNLPGFNIPSSDNDAQQMIATAESSTTAQYPHNKGEYFRLNGTLYKAIENISAGDAIAVNSNCKVAVLSNDLSDAQDEINDINIAINADLVTTWTYKSYIATNGAVGSVVNLTPTTNNSYRCAVLDCVEGDEFYLDGILGGSTPRAFAFVDNETKLLEYRAASSMNVLEPFVLTAPENAVKVIFNDHHSPLDGIIYKGVPPRYTYFALNKVAIDQSNTNASIMGGG